MRWRADGGGGSSKSSQIDVTYTLRVVECLLRTESRPTARNNLLRLLEGWQGDDTITDWCQRRARSLVDEFDH
jgi:hypothetical protein